MSGFKASRVALVAGVGAFGYLAISAFEGAQTSKSTGIPMAQNIDNRHSSAGGSGDSTPAAASQMGSEESREGRQEKAKGEFLRFVGSETRLGGMSQMVDG